MTISCKPFYFMRHGETDWNKQHIGMGQQDIPLNEKGLEQAYEAARLLRSVHFLSIATSPLKRAFETAQIIKGVIHSITVIEDLKECSWGVMEGKKKGDGKWLGEWRKDIFIEGAEFYTSFKKRVIRGLHQALSLPGPVLVVAHGGVYWAIQEALNLPFVDLPNGIPFYHRPPQHPMHPWFIYDIAEQKTGS